MFQHCGFSRTFEALHWEPWLFWRRCWCWELFSLIDGILTFRNCGFFSELDEFGVFLKLLCVEWISKLLLLTRRLPMGTLKLTGKGNCVNKTKLSNFYERTLTSFWIQIWGFKDSTIWCMNTSRPRRIVDTIGKTPISQTNFQNPEFIQSVFHLEKIEKVRRKPKIGNQSQVHFRDYFSHSYLIVKEEIDGSYENTLKRVEEMRCDGPNCKTQPRST